MEETDEWEAGGPRDGGRGGGFGLGKGPSEAAGVKEEGKNGEKQKRGEKGWEALGNGRREMEKKGLEVW